MINNSINPVTTAEEQEKETLKDYSFSSLENEQSQWLMVKKTLKTDLNSVLSRYYYIPRLPKTISIEQLDESFRNATNHNISILKYPAQLKKIKTHDLIKDVKKIDTFLNTDSKGNILYCGHAFLLLHRTQDLKPLKSKFFIEKFNNIVDNNNNTKLENSNVNVNTTTTLSSHENHEKKVTRIRYSVIPGLVRMPHQTYDENTLVFTMLHKDDDRINLSYIINEMLNYMRIPPSLINFKTDLGILDSKSGKIEKIIVKFRAWQIASLLNLFWDYPYARIHFLKYDLMEQQESSSDKINISQSQVIKQQA